MLSPSTPGVQKVNLLLVLIALVSSITALLWVSFLLDPELTRDYVMEDGFFYIETAHNFGDDFKFTFDGFNPTNGFHYLYMASLVVMDRFVPLEGLGGVRAVILLHGVTTLAAGVLAAFYAGRLLGKDWRPAALIAVIAVQAYYSIGTEAALLSLTVWAFLNALSSDQQRLLSNSSRRMDQVWVVILVAAVSLARTEAVILAITCGVTLTAWHLLFNRSTPAALHTLAVTVLPAISVAAIVTVINVVLTGHPMTISAYLKNDFPDLLNNEWLSYQGLGSKARIVVPPVVALIASGFLLIRCMRSERSEIAVLLGWLGFNAYLIIYVAFIYLFAIGEGTLRTGGVQPYYFDLIICGTVLNALFITKESLIWISQNRRLPSFIRPLILWVPAISAAAILILGGARFQRFTSYHPSTDVVNATTGEWIRDNLPPDARVFAIDHAGIMGYVSERSIVNGDGLINSWSYLEALEDGTLEQWLRDYGVGYVYVGTGEGDPVGSLETRDGKSVVVARLQLRGTASYELVGEVGQQVYQAPFQWVFPVTSMTISVQ